MAARITGPLFITCARASCGQVKAVRNRSLQQVQRFCSRRCATSSRVGSAITQAAQSRGGKMRAHRARLALLERIKDLSPVEAFRVGYTTGLGSKWRQTARARQKASAA